MNFQSQLEAENNIQLDYKESIVEYDLNRDDKSE